MEINWGEARARAEEIALSFKSMIGAADDVAECGRVNGTGAALAFEAEPGVFDVEDAVKVLGRGLHRFFEFAGMSFAVEVSAPSSLPCCSASLWEFF
jgi:hypothetical protein